MESPTWKVRDLAGSRVETADGVYLGDLCDVLPSKANDVFVVRNDREEILIPALKKVVLQISVAEKKIVVQLPPGLLEIYAKNEKHEDAKKAGDEN